MSKTQFLSGSQQDQFQRDLPSLRRAAKEFCVVVGAESPELLADCESFSGAVLAMRSHAAAAFTAGAIDLVELDARLYQKIHGGQSYRLARAMRVSETPVQAMRRQ